MAENPFFIELKNNYINKDVAFYSIAKDSKDDLLQYVSQTGFNWPLFFEDDVKYEYCIDSYPTTIILDKENSNQSGGNIHYINYCEYRHVV